MLDVDVVGERADRLRRGHVVEQVEAVFFGNAGEEPKEFGFVVGGQGPKGNGGPIGQRRRGRVPRQQFARIHGSHSIGLHVDAMLSNS